MKVHHAVRHGADFLLLALIIALGLGGVLFFRFDVASQIAIVLLMCALYVFWGVFHHLNEREIISQVVLEYVAMAALVAFVLILFLLRV